jgi:hypothetical protein
VLNVHAAEIEAAIHRCAVVATFNLNTVQLGPNTGYVEGEVVFVNGSRLVFFEFLRQIEAGLDQEKYRYQLMDANNQILFRYDNAPHYPHVATFPHHKHLPTDVIDSFGSSLVEVFNEVEAKVLGIP